MNALKIYRLSRLSVIDVAGADAATILHNVTTNAVKSLADGEGCETFITDVRGKTLGHGYLYRQGDEFRYWGAAGQSETILAHLDKYTIREDATPTIQDDHFCGLVFSPDLMGPLEITPPAGAPAAACVQPQGWRHSLGGHEVTLFSTSILGPDTIMALVPREVGDGVCQWLQEKEIALLSETEFHDARTSAGFPWYSIDIDDKNLPQEVDRDASAISFTKGCYLGQETIARLDAMGQVQRKLVQWSITGDIPAAGATLDADGKTVGRLTSIAATAQGTVSQGTNHAGEPPRKRPPRSAMPDAATLIPVPPPREPMATPISPSLAQCCKPEQSESLRPIQSFGE